MPISELRELMEWMADEIDKGNSQKWRPLRHIFIKFASRSALGIDYWRKELEYELSPFGTLQRNFRDVLRN